MDETKFSPFCSFTRSRLIDRPSIRQSEDFCA